VCGFNSNIAISHLKAAASHLMNSSWLLEPQREAVHLFPDVDVHHLLLHPTTWRSEFSLWLRFPIQSEPDDLVY
jgi:hypothetical protein